MFLLMSQYVTVVQLFMGSERVEELTIQNECLQGI
jgi:hypothetical protein